MPSMFSMNSAVAMMRAVRTEGRMGSTGVRGYVIRFGPPGKTITWRFGAAASQFLEIIGKSPRLLSKLGERI